MCPERRDVLKDNMWMTFARFSLDSLRKDIVSNQSQRGRGVRKTTSAVSNV